MHHWLLLLISRIYRLLEWFESSANRHFLRRHLYTINEYNSFVAPFKKFPDHIGSKRRKYSLVYFTSFSKWSNCFGPVSWWTTCISRRTGWRSFRFYHETCRDDHYDNYTFVSKSIFLLSRLFSASHLTVIWVLYTWLILITFCAFAWRSSFDLISTQMINKWSPITESSPVR